MGIVKESLNFASPLERSRAINGDFGHKYKKETQTAKIRAQFAAHFADSPDYQPETQATVNGVPRRLIVSKHKSELTQKDVIAYPGEDIGLGDMVECYGAHWIVTKKDPNTDMYSQGLMELCNTKIRWQNADTLDIVERWVIIKNPYSTNVRESQTLTTLNGKYEVYITKDEESIAVPPDKRFIIGEAGGKPLVYKLTFPDINAETFDEQGPGIIVWNLVSDEDVRESDNLDLMIADYIEPTQSNIKPGDEAPLYSAIIRGNNTVVVGYSRIYVCDFTDGNGIIQKPENLTNIVWTVKCDRSIEQFVALEQNATECRVSIADEDDAINQKFILSCQCDGSDVGSYEIECVVM